MGAAARVRRGMLVLLACVPAGTALAQTPATERMDPPSAYAAARANAGALRDARDAVSQRLVELASGAAPDSVATTGRRTALLGRAQHVADSLDLLDRRLVEATRLLRAARSGLLKYLEARADSLHREADASAPPRRAALDARLCEVEATIRDLRADHEPGATEPFPAAVPGLEALARAAADELAHLRSIETLEDELRRFMGHLRVFDETGMPPSVRQGGDPGGGCPSTCPIGPPGGPGDVPVEHARPDAAAVPGAGTAGMTPASLLRLQGQLAARGAPWVTTARDSSPVTGEVAVGLGATGFRRHGEGRSGGSLSAVASVVHEQPVRGGTTLRLEPWTGIRAVHLGAVASAEIAAEARETLTGTAAPAGLSWDVSAWQKVRWLSDPLPLPAYLEPGRREGGLAGRLSLPFRSPWFLDAGGGIDLVRYGAEDWEVLDHEGVHATLGLSREGVSHSVRLVLAASRLAFPGEAASGRTDARMGLGIEGARTGRAVVRLSAGLARNDSRLAAYDYGSARAAVVVAAPWGGNTVQGYGAFAHQSYLEPGPEDRRVAPSDHDTGSMLVLQLTRPLAHGRTVSVRAAWSRSVTGFDDDFNQRFGVGLRLAFRAPGAP